ncbi:MAG: glycosyltransferase family 4 protein [Pseudomonadota bacterium]
MSDTATLLFLNPDPRASAGCNISMLRLIEGLDRTRFAPIVAAPRDCGYATTLKQLGVPLFDYTANNWWFPEVRHFYRHLAGLRARVESLIELIESQRVELVYTNAEYAFEGGLAAALSGKPHVWAQRVRFANDLDVLAHFPLSKQALFELMIDLSDRIVPNSNDGRSSFPDAGADRRFVVIESGIALPESRFSHAEARAALCDRIGINSDSRIVLTVGRVSPEKDVHTWLRAAARVLQMPDASNVHFVHAGGITVPPYFAELQTRAHAPDLSGRVHFIGSIAHETMPDLYRAADIFTLTSTRFEGFARVAAEAMLSGLPVVSTRCGGVEDYIVDSHTGFLCEVGDETALADRITQLLNDTALAQRIGETARQTFLDRYAESTLNAKWDALFSELVGTPPSQRPRLKYEIALNMLTHLGELGLQVSIAAKPSLWKRFRHGIRTRLASRRDNP